MRNILTILFCLVALVSYGQDTTYYDYYSNKVSSVSKAHYYKISQRDQTDTNRVKICDYYITGQIKSETNYSDLKNKKIDGKYKEWFEGGQLHKDIDYDKGKKNGNLMTYWSNGKPKRIDVYKNDSLISGKCYNTEGKEVLYYDYERMPEFPGGAQKLSRYISSQIRYPKKMVRRKIGGRVLVGFKVDVDGRIYDVKITRSVNPELDAEAMRVVMGMPRWYPGLQDGEAVKVSFNIPIVFQP